MKIIIEENDVLKIYIFTKEDLTLDDMGLDPKDEDLDKKLRPILYCLRLSPFKREEIWNVYEDSIVNNFIEKFKALKENEEAK